MHRWPWALWLRSTLHAWRSADWATKAFVLLVAAWMVGMSAFAVLRYYTFQTTAFDLGIFNQAFATALRGRLFYETPDLRVIPSGSFLGVHFNLLMFGLLPFYALVPTAQTLLVLQTVFLGLGAVPVWLVSKAILGNTRLSLLVSAAFLFNPGILALGIFDFHLEAFLPFFLGMFFYSFLAKRWKSYALFLALALATIEFAAVLAFMIALFHLLRATRVRRARINGRWRIPLSVALGRTERVVLLATAGVTPLAFYGLLAGSAYFSGTTVTPTGLLSGFARSPSVSGTQVQYWWQFWLILFGSVLFLPCLAPKSLVMVLPWFVITILAVPITFVIIGYQYAGAFVAPYLIWGVVFGLRRLRTWRRTGRHIAALLVSVLAISILLSPLNPMVHGNLPGVAYHSGLQIPTAHTDLLAQAAALIPPDASVLTQNNLFPQLSGRANAYVYLVNATTDVQYIFADTSTAYYGQPMWGNQTMSRWLPYFLSTGAYGVLVMDDGVVLLEKGYDGPILLQNPTVRIYNYEDLTLFYGSVVADPTSVSGMVLSRTSTTTNGTFFYGPYTRVPPGTYNVTFRMKAGRGATGGMLLDAFFPLNQTSGLQLGYRYLNATDFPVPDVWTAFTVRFSLPPSAYFSSALEFRGMYAHGGPFYLDEVTVIYVGAP